MTTHTRHSLLNSYTRTPVDPYNNYPAPTYNRPKVFYGRLNTATGMTATTTTTRTTPMSSRTKLYASSPLKETQMDPELWATSSGMRTLAQFYQSIPDYGDINHLPEQEFYSTLDTLRSTCRELRTKPMHASYGLEEQNILSPSMASPPMNFSDVVIEKPKKSTKKKGNSKKSSKKKHASNQPKETKPTVHSCYSETPCRYDSQKRVTDSVHYGSFREDIDEEVESFKKTLNDFRTQLIRPTYASIYRPKSTTFLAALKSEHKLIEETEPEHLSPARKSERTAYKNLSRLDEAMRKSFSFDDLHSFINDAKIEDTKRSQKEEYKLAGQTKEHLETLRHSQKRNNHCLPNITKNLGVQTDLELPQIIAASPSCETDSSKQTFTISSRLHTGRKKKSKMKQYRMPFTAFNIDSPKKENIEYRVTPVYPVARPNLAATLRAEVSKKKLKELQSNCTYHDNIPQEDWEVRKTPAWKSLSMNESHKRILDHRLKARKAEQALQKREYELSMALMRQRVKTAPLLLEGPTYWGPSVGKSSHSCQRDTTKHICHNNNKQTQHKKSAGTSRMGTESEELVECPEHDCSGKRSHVSNKISTLRKIYSGSAKSQAQSTQRSASMGRSCNHEGPCAQRTTGGSGDELSSADRDYL